MPFRWRIYRNETGLILFVRKIEPIEPNEVNLYLELYFIVEKFVFDLNIGKVVSFALYANVYVIVGVKYLPRKLLQLKVKLFKKNCKNSIEKITESCVAIVRCNNNSILTQTFDVYGVKLVSFVCRVISMFNKYMRGVDRLNEIVDKPN